MQISSINTINYNSRPTFMSWEREVRNAKKGVINRNNTCFFRENDLFSRLTKLLSESFENVPKVNVYCFGCSDGSEAFTFIMSMLSLKEEATPQKFFPIIARDIDPVAIEKVKNNDYKIYYWEKWAINKYTDGMFDKFINEPYEIPENDNVLTKVFVKKELYDYVDFAVGDIFEDYKTIKPQNSVVLARNFWPYIEGSTKRNQLLKALYDHLDYGSYFVIGDFDQKGVAYQLQGNFNSDIIRTGFKPTEIKYVYIK